MGRGSRGLSELKFMMCGKCLNGAKYGLRDRKTQTRNLIVIDLYNEI